MYQLVKNLGIDLSQEEHSHIDLCQHVPEQVMNAGV